MKIKSLAKRSVNILSALLLLAAALQPIFMAKVAHAASTLTINPNQTYQTVDGFGTSINSGAWNNGELQPALDMLVDQNGSKIMRVIIENMDWENTNDNSDPNTFNWTYYNNLFTSSQFENLWSTMAYLNQKGITDTMILNFMGKGPDWMGGRALNTAQEDEWVEMVVAVAYYARNTRGLQFGYFAPNNEADWPDYIEGVAMDNVTFARVMNKVATRLNALGMTDLQMIGPDNATCPGQYYDSMMQYPTLMAKVHHVTIHSYGGSDCSVPGQIAGSAYPDRNWWVSEFSAYSQAYTQLNQGASGLITWDGFESVYNHAILNGRGSNPPNDSGNGPSLLAYNTSTGAYTPYKEFYQFAQIFRYIPAGAQRIGASSSGGGVKALAFKDPVSGKVIIYGENSGSATTVTVNLTSVPGVTTLSNVETTSSLNLQQYADVAGVNGVFSMPVQGGSVFTFVGDSVPDTQAPTVPSNVVATPTSQSTVGLTWSASTDNIAVAHYVVSRDGTVVGQPTSTSFNDTGLSSNTTYNYTIQAVDAAGNQSAASSSVSATTLAPDTQPPTTPGNLVSGTVTATQISFSWAASTDNVGVTGYQVFRGGTQVGTPTATSFTDTNLTPSTSYAYTVKAVDAAGNTSAASAPLSVTTSDASTQGLVAAYGFNEGSGNAIADASVNANNGTAANTSWLASGKYGAALNFNGSSSMVTVSDNNSLDLTNGMTVSAWVKPTNLNGWTTIALKANGTDSLAYALYASDNTNQPPVIYAHVGTDQAAKASSALSTGSWSYVTGTYDGSTLKLYVNGTQVSSRSLTGNMSITTGALTIGGNSVWGEYFNGAIDEVRLYNRALSPAEITTDMNTPIAPTPPAPDTTAPVISAMASSNVAQNTATVSWTTDEPSDSQVEYGTTTAYGSSTTLATSPVTAHIQNLSGLSASTTYHYRVLSRDAAGNLATSADGSFTTLAPPDTQAPTVPTNLGGTPTINTVNLSWSASTDNVGVTGYRVYRNGTQIAQVTGTTYTDTGLSAGTTYSYTVTALDAAGNQSAASPAANITTDTPPPDTTPPTISAVTSSNVGLTGATVSWTTDEASDSQVEYGTTTAYGSTTTLDTNLATAHSQNLSSLSSGTTYHYRVLSRDAAGNLATSADGTFTTTAPDTQAPTVPTGLATTSVSATQVALAWAASTDNVGVTGYRVYRNGTQVGTPSGTSFTNSGLTPSTAYTYTVQAVDAAGNVSATSAPLAVTTPSASVAGLVAAFGFNEGSGNAILDASTSANNGVASNTTWLTTGKYGAALDFNGTSSKVTVADSNSLDLTNGMTISAWVNPRSLSGWTTIALKPRNSNSLVYGLYASDNTNQPPAIYGRISSDKFARGSSALPLNTWSYVTGTYDGATMKIYVNGVLVGSRNQTGNMAVSNLDLTIGGNTPWGEYFNGVIDEVRIYNRALTASEINTDMNTPI